MCDFIQFTAFFTMEFQKKQTRSRTVWIALKLVYISMQITYSFPSNWNILAFVVYLALLTLTCKHVYANYPSFSSFCWRQKWHLWFPRSDACLFGHPVHFDYQDFLSFTSDFSFQHFKAGKLSWWLIFNIKIIICL